MNFKVTLIWPLLMLALFGCSIAGIVHPRIDIEFENQSSNDMENTSVHFGKFECRVGALARTALAGYGDFPHPITANTEVHWDVRGTHHMEKLDLDKIFEKGKGGTLMFTITDQGVKVDFNRKRVP